MIICRFEVCYGKVKCICCECGTVYNEYEHPDVDGVAETHGYCQPCYEKEMADE